MFVCACIIRQNKVYLFIYIYMWMGYRWDDKPTGKRIYSYSEYVVNDGQTVRDTHRVMVACLLLDDESCASQWLCDCDFAMRFFGHRNVCSWGLCEYVLHCVLKKKHRIVVWDNDWRTTQQKKKKQRRSSLDCNLCI